MLSSSMSRFSAKKMNLMNKLIYAFFFLLISALLLSSSGSQTQHHFKKSEHTNPIMTQASVESTTPISCCNRQKLSSSDFITIFIAIFTYLLTPISVSIKKVLFKIQYLLVDLDISILSSRAHPPTP